MTVEKVALNTKLDDKLFAKPNSALLPEKRVFTVASTGTANPSASSAAAASQKPTAR
jgi:hypothetical protein